MPSVRLRFLLLAALPVQLIAFAGHLIILNFFPKAAFLRDALPLAYLGITYLQWLSVAIFISWRTKTCPVPFLMHLPHLLSFLPLLRHVMLAAERTPSDSQSLTLAWLHSVATHSFSLVAAWLWQTRRQRDAHAEDLLRHEAVPLALYALSALTSIVLYAGLDFSFASGGSPWAIGILQFFLNVLVTGVLLYREHGGLKPFAVIAAAVFSLVNAALLFDKARTDIGVEAALAATSFTQIFSLFVFLIFTRREKA